MSAQRQCLAAKPVIDIQVSVRDLGLIEALGHRLASIGYAHVNLGEFDLIYPFFQKPAEWPASHHVHLCAVGGEQERKHLAFRDFLRSNPLVADQYLALKRQLAASHHGSTMKSREQYSPAKSSFVAFRPREGVSGGLSTLRNQPPNLSVKGTSCAKARAAPYVER